MVKLRYDEIGPADSTAAGVKLPVIDNGGQSYDVRAFGDIGTGAEIQAAIDAAVTSAIHVVNVSKGVYTISEMLTLASPVRVNFGAGAVLQVAPGFSDDYAIYISGDNVILDGLVLDGANLPVATSPFTGAEPPRGTGIRVQGTAEAYLQNVRIDRARISNTPFSAIFASYAQNFRAENIVADGCSTNTAMAPPASLQITQCVNPFVTDYVCYSPGAKGLGFSNCTGGGADKGYVIDGDEGQAAFFTANCSHMQFSKLHTEGAGFGIKHDRADSITTRGCTARGVSSGFFVQGGNHVNFIDCTVEDPEEWGFHADPHPSYNHPLSNVQFISCRVRRADATYVSTQRAFGVQARTGLDADNVSYIDCEVDGSFYGIIGVLSGSGIIRRVNVRGGVYQNIENAAFVLRGTDLMVDGPQIKGAGASGIQISSAGSAGRSLMIRGARIEDVGAYGVVTFSSTPFDIISITDIQVRGVANSVVLVDQTPVGYLRISGIQQGDAGGTANAINITARTDQTTEVNISDNQIPGRRINVTNGEFVTGYMGRNEDASLISGRPVNVEPYWGSGSPEGVVTAFGGKLYRDVAGAVYVKTVNGGTTGWEIVTTATP